VRFLVEHHITLDCVEIVAPPEYEKALREALPEVVEGEAREVVADIIFKLMGFE